MNILKLNRIFYLFFTLAVVGILVTSCERENLQIDQVENQDYSILSKDLAENLDFQKIVEITKNIKLDFADFNLENEMLIQNNPSIMENFINSYGKFKDEFEGHTKKLISTFPELVSMEEDNFIMVYEQAQNKYLLLENNLQERSSCWTNCHNAYLACDASCYWLYKSRICTYSEYLSCNDYCHDTYFTPCIDDC